MSAIAVLQRPADAAAPDRADQPPALLPDWRRRCAIVRVEGELDAAVAEGFRQAVGQAVTASSRAVVLDLRGTRFLSIGIARWLAVAKRAAAGTGVDLRIVSGRREIERVLEITGVRPLFRYYAGMQLALDA
ncbi:STAS domain-containing protein [Nocardia sp. BMG51109]|uniref:STAS domain-containing protein n=1 Tax=Nocardia sp. BMG51109 TaxID=1056816 RepID=UPI0004669DD5|nr:STAS domain-containing protein [Nocardia sp. BMG51109]